MSRFRFALVLAAAAGMLAVTGATQAAPQKVTKLFGQAGPGFTITLKRANFAPVRKLKAGLYTFVIQDRATNHNFHLKGPGVDKKTPPRYLGTKTWKSVRLKKGTYRFWCDPHRSRMHGSFRVV